MKKCIMFVINSLYGGGAEHAASRIISLLRKKYFVVVVSILPETNDDFDFGENVVSMAQSYTSKFWLKRIKDVSKEIDKLAEEYHPIAIISFLQNANLCLAMTKCHSRKIISIRNYLEAQYTGYKQVLWKLLIKHYFKRADKIVSVSEMINDEMIDVYKMPKEKCICINNLYDVQQILDLSIEPLEEEYQCFCDQKIVISSMGRVSAQKGHFHLVRVLNELLKSDKTYVLTIIGNDTDEYAKRVKELVKDYDLSDHVFFTGKKNNPYKYIKNSMCFAFPSRYEGFPNALVEAMICKVPVIAADCPSGPGEILKTRAEEFGFLIECSKEKFLDSSIPLTEVENEYCKIIQALANDKKMREDYAQRAFTRANDFSADSIIKRWIEVIEEDL